jgi:hypothetical protein
MLDILFRGKRRDNNEWVYGSLILAGSYCCILELEENVHPMHYPYLDDYLGTIDGKATPVDPKTIGRLIDRACYNVERQCTLFEGDIIRLHDKRGNERGVAIVCDEHSMSENGLGRRFTQDTVQVTDVIGNVWDNPELVGKKYADLYLYYYGYGNTITREVLKRGTV